MLSHRRTTLGTISFPKKVKASAARVFLSPKLLTAGAAVEARRPAERVSLASRGGSANSGGLQLRVFDPSNFLFYTPKLFPT